MTVIDCHAHLGRNQHINYSVDQLLTSMDKAKIDKALVFAGKMNDCSNEWMLQQIAPHRDRLYGVAAADMAGESITWRQGIPAMSDLQNEALEISNWYGEGKIVACKFYTGYHHYYPFDRLIEDYLISLEDVSCPAIFHCGDCLSSIKDAKLKYAHPLHIDDVAIDYPNMKFIIAHMGYPWHRDAAEVIYKNKNVFADISGFVYGGFGMKNELNFRKVVEEFVEIAGGTNQILFGSDAPISHQDDYVLIASKILPEEIFFENPKKVFNL